MSSDAAILTDAHTHHMSPLTDAAVVDVSGLSVEASAAINARYVSMGIHPCSVPDNWQAVAARIAAEAAAGHISAVGECGFDRTSSVPLGVQQQVFTSMADIAAATGLPMILHIVRAADIILAQAKVRREGARWIVHGFRGKPATMRQFLDAGFTISFGVRYNEESARICPSGRILLETDTAAPELLPPLYDRLSALRDEDLAVTTAANFSRLFAPATPRP